MVPVAEGDHLRIQGRRRKITGSSEGKLLGMRPPWHLIIFDCDGVLIDSEPVACEVLASTLCRYGVHVDAAYVTTRFVGRSLNALIDDYAADGTTLPASFRTDLDAALRRGFEHSLQPIAGIKHLLEKLRIPSCVASSSNLNRVTYSLELTGLSPYFKQRIFTAESVRRGKPWPELFEYAAASMGVPAGQVLVIEDSVGGVKAARAAGMEVWGFVGGGHHYSPENAAEALSSAGAAFVYASMRELGERLLTSDPHERTRTQR